MAFYLFLKYLYITFNPNALIACYSYIVEVFTLNTGVYPNIVEGNSSSVQSWFILILPKL